MNVAQALAICDAQSMTSSASAKGTDLGGEADIGRELFSRAAAVLEALDVQQQHFWQAMKPHTLCGLGLLGTDLTLEALITLHSNDTNLSAIVQGVVCVQVHCAVDSRDSVHGYLTCSVACI